MPENKFCKNCVYFNDGFQHCTFGYNECRTCGPTTCIEFQSFEESRDMSKKKEFLCHGCNFMVFSTPNKAFCSKNQVFFNTKKAEGCKVYDPILSKTVITPLIEHKPKTKFMGVVRGNEFKTLVTETTWMHMVK